MRKRAPISEQWARARIALNLLDLPTATAAALAARHSARLPSGSRALSAEVVGCPDIPPGWCFFLPGERVAILNRDVYDAHACSYEMHAFCDRIVDLREPTWLHYDQESWELMNDLYAAQAAAERTAG